GHHILPRGVDRPVGLIAVRRQVRANGRDGAVLAVDVGDVIVRRRDDAAVGDEERHGAAIVSRNDGEPPSCKNPGLDRSKAKEVLAWTRACIRSERSAPCSLTGWDGWSSTSRRPARR